MSQQQFTFRAASAGPIRDKAAACYQCDRKPERGEKFMMCSGCKEVTYCSKECQRQSWKVHKPLCLYQRRRVELAPAKEALHAQMPEYRGLPPDEERVALLEDWAEAHSWSLSKAVSSALFLKGGAEEFAYAREYMVMNLRYRRDCGGNPALAFRVESVRFAPPEELMPPGSDLQVAWESGRLMREASEARLRATNPAYIGLLMILVVIEGLFLWFPQEQYRGHPLLEVMFRRQNHDNWVENLQSRTEAGYVFRRVDEGIEWYIGHLKKSGSGWKWKQYSGEELIKMGYPADYKIIV